MNKELWTALLGAGIIAVIGKIIEQLLAPYVTREATRLASEEVALKREQELRRDQFESRKGFLLELQEKDAEIERERARADGEREKRMKAEDEAAAQKRRAEDAEALLARRGAAHTQVMGRTNT